MSEPTKPGSGHRRYAINTGWLFAEKLVRLVVGFGTGVLVARHLGAEGYGLLSYVLSLLSFLTAIASVGLVDVLTQRLVERPHDEPVILGSALVLKLGASVAAILVVAMALPWSGISGSLLLIATSSLVFRAMDVVRQRFYARVEARETARADVAGILCAGIGRVIGVALGFGVAFFVVLLVVEAAAVALMLGWLFYRSGGRYRTLRAQNVETRRLLAEGVPLVFSGLLIGVYLRIDQVMIKAMLGDAANGHYAVAVGLSEIWQVVPRVVVASLLPAVIAVRARPEEFRRRLQLLLDLMSAFSLVISVPLALFADLVIATLYGDSFAAAASPLRVLVWAGVLSALSTVTTKWYVIENRGRLFLLNTAIGAALNVVLNLALIPAFGIRGAGIATLIAYAGALYLGLVMHRESRFLFAMTNAALNPVRLARVLPAVIRDAFASLRAQSR